MFDINFKIYIRRVVHAGDSEMRFQCPDCGKKYPSRAKRDFENHCKTHSGKGGLKKTLLLRVHVPYHMHQV